MTYESLVGSIVGFNGTTAGRQARTAEELRNAWLRSKLDKGSKGYVYLELYEEFCYDKDIAEEIDELLLKLKRSQDVTKL